MARKKEDYVSLVKAATSFKCQKEKLVGVAWELYLCLIEAGCGYVNCYLLLSSKAWRKWEMGAFFKCIK
jgi:hypothetical protein